MKTLFTTSPDGTRIAYEIEGDGPPLVLVHGGGGSRREWHEAGYVNGLRDSYSVITLDLRGHGESESPTDPAEYTTGKMGQDILAVADACGVNAFIMLGMSFGGKISRYLAVQSGRVEKFIMMGTPMGRGVSGIRRQEAVDYVARWSPIVRAQLDGTLDIESLKEDERTHLSHFNVPVMLAWVTAMLDWPIVRPADFSCPTLWLIGSEDQAAMVTYEDYRQQLPGSAVRVHVVEGLDHNQLFDEIEAVLPTMLAFNSGQYE